MVSPTDAPAMPKNAYSSFINGILMSLFPYQSLFTAFIYRYILFPPLLAAVVPLWLYPLTPDPSRFSYF